MSESSCRVLHDFVVVVDRDEVADEDEAEHEFDKEGLDTVFFHFFVLAGQSVDESDPAADEDREDEEQLALGSVFSFMS